MVISYSLVLAIGSFGCLSHDPVERRNCGAENPPLTEIILNTFKNFAIQAVAALVIEWAATVGECILPMHFGQVCRMTDPYVYPPVTIALAFLLSWIIATQVLERFDRRHNARSVG